MSNSTTNATSKHFAPYTQTCSMSTISDKKLSGKVYSNKKATILFRIRPTNYMGAGIVFSAGFQQILVHWVSSSEKCPLTHLFPKLNFYTSRKHRKTFGFAGVSREYKIITLTTNGFKDENILGKLMCKN